MSESPMSEAVWAVVVTYNRKERLRACLRALQGQTHPLAGLLVVNNASTDGTARMLDEEFPAVERLQMAENKGGAGGFHAGFRHVQHKEADWLWVMDDDVEPTPDALEQLFAPGLHRHPGTAGLTSLNVHPSEGPQPGHSGWYDPVRMKITGAPVDGAPVEPVAYSSFAGLLVRAEAARQAGPPRADFFIWGDDMEFCLRLAETGPLYLVRSSVVMHDNVFSKARRPLERPPFSRCWRLYYGFRNRLLIAGLHAERPSERVAAYAAGFYRVMRSAMASLVGSEDRRAERLQLLVKAYVDGVRGRSGKQVDPAHFQPPNEPPSETPP